MSVVHLLLSKEGNSQEECEDSLEYREDGSLFIAAIADGASQGYESKLFSGLLCEHFVERFKESQEYDEKELRGKLDHFLKEVIEAFNAAIMEKTRGRELKWYEENAIGNGSFSTFMGLVFDVGTKKGYLLSVGDCFLFQVKDAEMKTGEEDPEQVLRIYSENHQEQSNTPYLLATNRLYNMKLPEYLFLSPITVENGEALILATDAFSYFLIDHTENIGIIKSIAKCDKSGLKRVVETGRRQKRLKNDDVAIIIKRFERLPMKEPNTLKAAEKSSFIMARQENSPL